MIPSLILYDGSFPWQVKRVVKSSFFDVTSAYIYPAPPLCVYSVGGKLMWMFEIMCFSHLLLHTPVIFTSMFFALWCVLPGPWGFAWMLKTRITNPVLVFGPLTDYS